MKRSGTLSRVVGTRSGIPWCTQARVLVGPGVPGAPQPVATGRHWPRSTIPRVLLLGPHAGDVSGGGYGSLVPPVLRSRRSQGDGGCLPAPCDRRQGREGGSYVLDDNGRPDGVVRLAGREQVYADRDGGDWGLLEACVAHLGRR